MIEEMYSEDGETRVAFDRLSPEFAAAVAQLEAQFGPQPAHMWKSISSPQHNSIYDDLIVSTVNLMRPPYLDDLKPCAVGRKFFLNKGWIYDKVYLFTHVGDCTLPRPQAANPLFIGELLNIYGQPGDESLADYKCLYFSCADHSAVEEWAGKPLPQGAYQTFYSATFDTANGNNRLRMKTYTYETKGAFTDWEFIWNRYAAGRGVQQIGTGA